MTSADEQGSKPKAPDSPEPSKKESQKKLYAKRLHENRKKAGQGNVYYYRALKENIPLVFRGYDQELVGTIFRDGGIRFTLKLASGRKVVDKTELQYTFKARSHEEVFKPSR